MNHTAIPHKPGAPQGTDVSLERGASRLKLGMRPALMAGLLGLTLALFIASLAIGSINLTVGDTLTVLTGGEPERASATRIIMNVRLPKALTALTAGAALGVSGLMMQTFFRNPLAGPFVLGISSGASLGVALVVLSTGTVGAVMLADIGVPGDLTLAFAASIGAALTMLMVLFVARRVQDSMTLLILGVMFGYLTSAVVSLLLYFSIPEQIQSYVNWTFGSFSRVTASQLWILLPAVVVGLLLTVALVKSLNALLLGEAYARSMGLNVTLTRFGVVGATGLLAGVVTAFCGPIGFLGIAVPHLGRSLFNTSDHRVLVPATILLGAIVAMVAALIAGVPGRSIILPVNAVTAFLGAPVVIWVILRRRNLGRSFAS